jgi:hypothetical protein
LTRVWVRMDSAASGLAYKLLIILYYSIFFYRKFYVIYIAYKL